MTTRNEARSNTQREANTREEEFIFEEPDALEIPPEVEARFNNDGLSLRWLRISVKNQDDITNVGKKQQQGWVFVTPDEVPELAITSFVRKDGRYTGTVCRGDLALAKIPSNRVTARRKYYENKSNDLMDAVNAQLMRNNDSRMPISNTSKSVRTTGRQPSFQD
jgi:hypothetical protein